jgi:tRNA-specific 2-thiouridylase
MKVTSQINELTSTKVFVGLSGGVDSAVAAALLQRRGFAVTGVFIRIALPGYPCSAGEDKREAMRVAAHLKIPFLSIDLSKDYQERVFARAIKEFEAGRTPNPDALCNKEVKFGLFFDWARKNGADYIATGHYAQIKDGVLYAGADEEKDQSYFLWAVAQEKLKRSLFPVGGLKKSDVRALAEKLQLPNAARPDSQGLCFLGPISLSDMLHQELSPVEGMVRSSEGETIGTHEGATLYTLGQRHGFIITKKTPDTAPYFVVGKDISANTITVSTERYPKGVSGTRVELAEENWIEERPEGSCVARFRYRQKLIPATYVNGAVVLKEPHYVPEGQSLVLYQGARCLGGGVVEKSSLL